MGQTLLAQPAAPLGLTAVKALETQLSDLLGNGRFLPQV